MALMEHPNKFDADIALVWHTVSDIVDLTNELLTQTCKWKVTKAREQTNSVTACAYFIG